MMMRRYRDLSLKYQIFLPFFLFLLFMAAAIFLYGQESANRTILSNAGISNGKWLEQIITSISFLRSEVEDVSTQLIIQPTIQHYLQPAPDDEEKSKQYIDMDVRNAVNLIATKEYISELAILGFSNNTVPLLRGIDARFSLPDMERMESCGIYQAAMAAAGKPIWSDKKEDIQCFTDNPLTCMMMIRLVKDYNSYTNIGLLIVTISQHAFKAVLSQATDDPENGIVVLNSLNERIFSYGSAIDDAVLQRAVAEGGDDSDENWFVSKGKGGRVFLSYNTDNSLGWKFFYAVPAGLLLVRTGEHLGYIVPVIVIAGIFFTFLFALLSYSLTQPAQKLVDAMRQFHTGNMDIQVHFKYRDEIGQLGNEFNQMSSDIRDLIDHVYKLEIREREAEIMALQAQINPHFLYNTLDSIYWKAMKANENEIADMVLQLSRLFRLSLAKGKRFDRLQNEVAFLEEYLKLQKRRYGKKLEYGITLEEDCRDCLVPWMILQPIVENAVYHGIEEKTDHGYIGIQCIRRGAYVHITISDNGLGMRADMAHLLETGSGNGYGLKNVHDRLKLIYHQDFKLCIDSVKGSGTVIKLCIPVVPKHKEEEHDPVADRRG